MSTFLDELYAIGTLTDDHDTEYTPTHAEQPVSLAEHLVQEARTAADRYYHSSEENQNA